MEWASSKSALGNIIYVQNHIKDNGIAVCGEKNCSGTNNGSCFWAAAAANKMDEMKRSDENVKTPQPNHNQEKLFDDGREWKQKKTPSYAGVFAPGMNL